MTSQSTILQIGTVAISLDGDEWVELVQAGQSKRVQISTIWGTVTNSNSRIWLPEPTIVDSASYSIPTSVQVVIVQRVAPVSTSLTFPSYLSRNGMLLFVKDLSTSIDPGLGHTITCTPSDGTIDGDATYPIFSNPVSRSVACFAPSLDLGGWYQVG